MAERKELLVNGLGLPIVAILLAVSFGYAPTWLISHKAATLFHMIGLGAGVLGAGFGIWAFATGRAAPIPRNPANVLVLGLVFGLMGAGFGYAAVRYAVPPIGLLITGWPGEVPVVIQTNIHRSDSARRGCRGELPGADGDRFAGQRVCLWSRDFKRQVQGAGGSRALVRLDGWVASWGAVYWRTTLILPELRPAP